MLDLCILACQERSEILNFHLQQTNTFYSNYELHIETKFYILFKRVHYSLAAFSSNPHLVVLEVMQLLFWILHSANRFASTNPKNTIKALYSSLELYLLLLLMHRFHSTIALSSFLASWSTPHALRSSHWNQYSSCTILVSHFPFCHFAAAECHRNY